METGSLDSAFFVEHFSEAIKKGHIHAFYQPIYRSMTEKTMCAESLARWIDPEKGMLSPGLFIPVLEQNGLIFELDMEILRQTCAFYRELSLRGTPIQSFSVNLSRKDFKHERFFERVVELLDSHEVPHSAIKLEITESLMLDDAKVFQDILNRFTESGFSIWMDDFGSGYSSLNILKNYHFDLMKFDMMFLRDFSVKGRRLLASMINMAKSLGIHTLTEGVETEEQQHFLQTAGCESLQGYYHSKPVSKEDFLSMIDQEKSILETSDESDYWGQIGRLNFLSPRPLEEYLDIESFGIIPVFGSDAAGSALALVECSHNHMSHIYVSNEYLKRIRDLGYSDASEIEQEFNSHRSSQYLMVKKLVNDAIEKGTIQRIEYSKNDVYYRLRAKCLAVKQDRVMLAFQLSTFDSEQEIKTAEAMINYGNALFSTYELVVLLYPESGRANRIYTSNNLPIYDREASLFVSVQKFCEAEVAPEDQERYLKFLDFNTVFQRVEKNPKGFVQGYFRMRWGGIPRYWHTVRLSKVPTEAEKTFLLTMQTIQGRGMELIDLISEEHPELLSE